MSTFNPTDLIAVTRNGTTYKAEFGDVNATIVNQAAQLLGSGMRNRLINGDFSMNTNGSQTTTLGPGISRNVANKWFTSMDGSTSSRQFTRVSTSPGTIFKPAGVSDGLETPFFLRYRVTNTGGATYNFLGQCIEDVRTLAGGQATLSFWAKAASPMTISWTELVQVFGTGGSPSSRVNIEVGQFNIGTSWNYYTSTVTVPSLAGKTIGTNGDDYLLFQMHLPVGVNTLELALVQLERGPLATPYETRMTGHEQVLAERYYQAGSGYLDTYAAGAGNVRIGQVFLQTTMRSAPSITLSAITGSNYSSLYASNILRDSFTVFANAGNAGRVQVDFYYSADSEFV